MRILLPVEYIFKEDLTSRNQLRL